MQWKESVFWAEQAVIIILKSPGRLLICGWMPLLVMWGVDWAFLVSPLVIRQRASAIDQNHGLENILWGGWGKKMEEEEKRLSRRKKWWGSKSWNRSKSKRSGLSRLATPDVILNFSMQMIRTNHMGYSVCKWFVPTDSPISYKGDGLALPVWCTKVNLGKGVKGKKRKLWRKTRRTARGGLQKYI